MAGSASRTLIGHAPAHYLRLLPIGDLMQQRYDGLNWRTPTWSDNPRCYIFGTNLNRRETTDSRGLDQPVCVAHYSIYGWVTVRLSVRPIGAY